ncbi:MAG: hypothetical protein ACMUIE_03710 [Thermoplasmatota archaeon]
MRRSMITLLSVLLAVLALFTVSVRAEDDLVIEDDIEDVTAMEMVEEEVSGFDEIDILSLTSEEKIANVLVTLTLKGDVSDEEGYMYTFSAGEVSIMYYDGEFDVSSGGPAPGIQTDVEDNTITATIPKAELDPETFNLYANTVYMDFGMADPESEFFTCTDELFEEYPPWEYTGTRQGSSGDFDRELQDESGDVVMMTQEEYEVDDMPQIDIVEVSLSVEGGDHIVTLEVLGDIADDETVQYSVSLGYEEYGSYCNGEGSIMYSGGHIDYESVSASGSTITFLFDGSRIEEYDYIYADAYESDFESQITYTDYASNDPWDYIDDEIGFEDMEILLEVEFLEIDMVEIRSVTTVKAGSYAEAMRMMLDLDSDDEVTEQEFADVMANPDESFVFGFTDSLSMTIDGQVGVESVGYDHEGIVGPVDSDEDIIVTEVITIEFSLGRSNTHAVALIDEYYDEEDWESYEEDDEYYEYDEEVYLPMTFRMIFPDGWNVDTGSIEPSNMSNYLDSSGRMVELGPEEIMEMAETDDGTIVSFDLVKAGKLTADDDDEVTSFGGSIGVVTVLVVVGLLLLVVLGVIGAVVMTRRSRRQA